MKYSKSETFFFAECCIILGRQWTRSCTVSFHSVRCVRCNFIVVCIRRCLSASADADTKAVLDEMHFHNYDDTNLDFVTANASFSFKNRPNDFSSFSQLLSIIASVVSSSASRVVVVLSRMIFNALCLHYYSFSFVSRLWIRIVNFTRLSSTHSLFNNVHSFFRVLTETSFSTVCPRTFCLTNSWSDGNHGNRDCEALSSSTSVACRSKAQSEITTSKRLSHNAKNERTKTITTKKNERINFWKNFRR